MIKKIIIGIAITAFLVLGGAGSIYAFQKEQEQMDTLSMDMGREAISKADSSLEYNAPQFTFNKNSNDCLAAENRHQHNNNFRNNVENNNCELEKNNYSREHNYNIKNENCSNDNCLEYKYNNRQIHSYRNFNSENKGNFFLRQNYNNTKK